MDNYLTRYDKFLRVLIFLVGVSMPFNNVALTIGRNLSLGFLSSVLYFMGMLFVIADIRYISRVFGDYVKLPLYYFILLFIVNICHPTTYNTPTFGSTGWLCLLLFATFLVHVQHDPKALSTALYGFTIGCIIMSIFFNMEIGVEIDEGGRLRMFGENSNQIGIYMCIGSIVILNEWILKDKLKLKVARFLLFIAYVPITTMIFGSASRTAFLIFAASLIFGLLLFPMKKSWLKFLFILIGAIGLWHGYDLLINSDSVLLNRLITTAEEGNLSGRDTIWKSLLPYVKDHPLFGVGDTGYVQISQEALGKVHMDGNIVYGYSPHNVIVETLILCGVFGLVIWLLFWGKIIKCSLKLWKRGYVMPFLLMLPIVAVILSGQVITHKWAYLLYAYIISEYVWTEKMNYR